MPRPELYPWIEIRDTYINGCWLELDNGERTYVWLNREEIAAKYGMDIAIFDNKKSIAKRSGDDWEKLRLEAKQRFKGKLSNRNQDKAITKLLTTKNQLVDNLRKNLAMQNALAEDAYNDETLNNKDKIAVVSRATDSTIKGMKYLDELSEAAIESGRKTVLVSATINNFFGQPVSDVIEMTEEQFDIIEDDNDVLRPKELEEAIARGDLDEFMSQ